MNMEEVDSENISPSAWYTNQTETAPFNLSRMMPSRGQDPLYTVAAFPWSPTSLDTLWDGQCKLPNIVPRWKRMTREWTSALALGGSGILRIVPGSQDSPVKPFQVRIPHDDESRDIHCVSWCISQDAMWEPLVVFACSARVYIMNVTKRKVVGYLRGHGGPITSIAVHPTHPYIFCTTSRDFTTRIYDITLKPCQKPSNPHWPPNPSTVPSRAGAAYGLHGTESEGEGVGRCVAVLCGGRSGGHQAAVLHAAFHPSLPLVATCGMDRAVKIWRLPAFDQVTLSREDKPLFSSSRIHTARVLSVSWLSQDILLTHSAPALMRTKDRKTYDEAGTMTMWRWLGVDRFFPPGQLQYQKMLRGCASDYQESASFKLISVNFIPMSTRHVHVYQTPTHPLALYVTNEGIRIVSLIDFTPRVPSPYPEPDRGDEDVRVEGESQGNTEQGHRDINSPRKQTATEPPLLGGWLVQVPQDSEGRPEEIQACQMSGGGNVIAGVGSGGALWVWRVGSRLAQTGSA
ncbi:hypothetical protein JAAARDRAFT_169149 [Jaapia argillacea MUCL 33604]|uniref:Uncharacterized protein n=1 Tax=Jaapia argillacea MUCL 33604 TaxID=933084 RepID=A0A067QB67_9AGAM|nr:hypothetical protein JAAARDRAFT_169149 [Jaapia argillacea MUCL 33604]